ncbi:hypothetical protein [Hyphomonas chukchiensis]|uniref:Uncharacterized protein n=1 Tax=Hyphomonas chukchiensis TaxID=1280947 RepID=A0A062UM01_9PROT|nr:hypothetical protein [Hyphomonas chukchiensis]KCZ57599.1 hypothetical protein HY30_05330 [Hyphomonas chukchiensis]
MTITHFTKNMALLLGVLAMSLQAAGEAPCSDRNASTIKSALESRLEAESSAVVWMKSNKQFELNTCFAADDGHQGEGTLSFTGSDGAAYWVKGRVRLNPDGKIVSNEFTDASSSFKTLAIMKAGAMAAAAGGR